MDGAPSQLQELIDTPAESLSVELKSWIDPDQSEGAAKIVKAALALRNHGGGYLVVGFNNNTREPEKYNLSSPVKSAFHIDKIQRLVSKFTSEPFEVAVEFPERDGQIHPVIVIPSGVKTPVVSRSDLSFKNGKLICVDDLYVRSLQSNNTASTTKIGWKDWPKIMEVCFDNREADIGRFLRRHLGGMSPDIILELAVAITKQTEPKPTNDDLLRKFLQESAERFSEVIEERRVNLPKHGTWEAALLVIGNVPAHSANRDFLKLLGSSNPDYTGWPVWLDSSSFPDERAHPHVIKHVWEALIVSRPSGWAHHVDFMRLDPKGRFYLRRALQDDISGSDRAPKPLSALDFALPILRVAEAIAVGIAFAKAMGCAVETTLLAFAFQWTGLRGRELVSWAEQERLIIPGRSAYDGEVLTFVSVPLETPLSALSEFVNQAVQPLFEIFDGFSLSKGVVEDLTRRLIERKL